MGAAHASLHNDTTETHRVFTFNYVDGLRTIAGNEYPSITPGETITINAGADFRGLVLATDRGADGHHMTVANGQTVNMSTLLAQEGNGWHKHCNRVCKAATIFTAAISGACVGAYMGLSWAAAAGAGCKDTGPVIVAGLSGGFTMGTTVGQTLCGDGEEGGAPSTEATVKTAAAAVGAVAAPPYGAAAVGAGAAAVGAWRSCPRRRTAARLG